MKIILSDTIGLDLLFIVMIAIVLLKSSYPKLNKEYLSTDNTNIMKGISVLLVILCHIGMFSVNKGIIENLFATTGLLAVAIFIFVSGYGLMTQYLKKDNYLKGFFKKFVNIYIVFIICNIVTTIINNAFLNTNYGIGDIIVSSLQFNFANGRELWFVACIIFMYISFYFSFKISKRKGILVLICSMFIYIILCRLIGKGTWWYNTVFCFPLGAIFAIYKEKIFLFYKKFYWFKFVVLLFIFLIFMYLYIRGYHYLQFIIPIIFVLLTAMMLVKVKLKSKFLLFINKISLEMYLIHLIILQVAFYETIARSSVYLVLLFPIMIVISIVIKYICDYVSKLCKLT